MMKQDVTLPDRIRNDFAFHPFQGDQRERQIKMLEWASHVASFIDENCKASREKSLALTKLEECTMWFTAALVRNE